MPLEQHVRRLLRQALAGRIGPSAQPVPAPPGGAVDDSPRLSDDARRLWRRIERFLMMRLVNNPPDLPALEMACYALQLPLRRTEELPVGRLGVTNTRERAERAAQRLVEEVGEHIPAGLLDHTTRLLYETPQRPPVLEEAKLLADALNLDDFGATGLLRQAIELGLRGDGVDRLAEGWEKRTAYGYWEARINDGFHFPQVRNIARRRLANAMRVADMLAEERREDAL